MASKVSEVILMINDNPNPIKCLLVTPSRSEIIKKVLVAFCCSTIGKRIGYTLERSCVSADVVNTGIEALELHNKEPNK